MAACEVESCYKNLVEESTNLSEEELTLYWIDELPYLCVDEYRSFTSRPTEIVRFKHGTFEYLFDNYSAFEHRGELPYRTWEEDRLVVVFGRSSPRKRQRDDSRLAGWVGKTTQSFGTAWDKGHYIAHSIGGTVDGVEVNVFVQRRDLNRGWSPQGKRFRQMEKYCVTHPNTFCFSRPLYVDGMSRPEFLDFGLLTVEGQLWVERFDNRPI